jgi:hypothetical protein
MRMEIEQDTPRRKCESISLADSDAMFFPGRGGKPFKAQAFCNDCTFVRQCLTEAIELRLEGFFAGTTETERKAMRPFQFMRSLMDFMPPEPDREARQIFLKVFTSEDSRSWMDTVEPTESELLVLDTAAS